MLKRINNLEKTINDLMELKITAGEFREALTHFNSQINQEEERISEIEDQLNDINKMARLEKKRKKRNEQSLQKIWD